MKCFLILFIFFFAFSSVIANPYYYDISLKYSDGNLSISDIRIIYLNHEPLYLSGNNYSLELYDSSSHLLHNLSFDVPNIIIYDDFINDLGGGIKYLDELNFTIYLPYSNEASKITLLKSNKEINYFSVLEYSKPEIYSSVNSDIIGDKTNSNKKSYLFYYILFFILILFLFILLLLILRKWGT